MSHKSCFVIWISISSEIIDPMLWNYVRGIVNLSPKGLHVRKRHILNWGCKHSQLFEMLRSRKRSYFQLSYKHSQLFEMLISRKRSYSQLSYKHSQLFEMLRSRKRSYSQPMLQASGHCEWLQAHQHYAHAHVSPPSTALCRQTQSCADNGRRSRTRRRPSFRQHGGAWAHETEPEMIPLLRE